MDLLAASRAPRLDALIGGHRGLTHSIPFALVLGLIVVLAAFAEASWRADRGRLWLYFAAATASHGLIDSLTAYGSGVALLAPISWIAVKAPWQPLSHGRCRGVLDCLSRGVGGELLWLALPSLLLAGTITWLRGGFRRTQVSAEDLARPVVAVRNSRWSCRDRGGE